MAGLGGAGERARTPDAQSVTGDGRFNTCFGDYITAFVDFLAKEGQEAFFWRLRSFEEHALRGNEFAIEGMKSDVQGLSVVVEHIAAALGGTGTQLFQKFRQLWKDPQVLLLLDRKDVTDLRKQFTLPTNWAAQKAAFQALRADRAARSWPTW